MERGALPSLAITGVGAVSPVGRSAVETCASIRAGICRFREWPGYTALTSDPDWEKPEPFVASFVSDVPPRASGPARLLNLARLALRDLFRGTNLLRADLARATMFLALPESDAASRAWGLGSDWGKGICLDAGLPELPVHVARTDGAPGSLAILNDVHAHLGRSPSELALVLFVDSYIDGDRLRALDDDARLKSARTTDGLMPGEAAVAMLLESPEAAARRNVVPVGFIGTVGVGEEPQVRASDKESSGRGLCDALRGALAGTSPAMSRWYLCDLNGQSYRAAEWGVTAARLAGQLSIANLWHPADCLGDVGAATGGILLAQALAGFARGYAPADEAVIWTSSSEHGLRAAVRVSKQT